jgi:hypothetical protein
MLWKINRIDTKILSVTTYLIKYANQKFAVHLMFYYSLNLFF